MLASLERSLARFGVGLGLVTMIAIVADLIGLINFPVVCQVGIGIVSVALVGSSFLVFQLQTDGRIEARLAYTVRTDWRSDIRDIALVGLFLSFLALPLSVVALKLAGVSDGTNFYDFGAYYNAAERVLLGHGLYDWSSTHAGTTELPNSPDRFLYAPITALLFLPFVMLGPGMAAGAWVISSTLFYIISVQRLLKAFDQTVSTEHQAVALIAALCFGPFVTGLVAGQVSILLAGCLTMAAVEIRRSDGDNEHLSGIWIALPSIFKPYYAPTGAVLLHGRRRLTAAVVTGISLLAGGLLIFSYETSIDYLTVLANGKGWGVRTDPVSQWNINEFHPLYYSLNIHFAVRILIFSVVTAVALYSRQDACLNTTMCVFSLSVCAFALGAPTIAPHALTAFVPVILFLLNRTYGRNDWTLYATIAGAFLIHIHSYTIEFLITYGPSLLNSSEAVFSVVPAMQPAVWGTILLTVVVGSELSRNLDIPKRS
jgi:hypothetical protein